MLLVNSCAEWSKRCVRGWPEMTPVTTLAVAGARDRGYGGRIGACEASTGPTRCGKVSGQDDGAVAWPEPRRRRAQAVAHAGELGAVHAVHGNKNGEGEEERKLTSVMT